MNIDPHLIGTISPWGVVLLVVLMIIRGLIIPRSTHKEQLADKDAQIHYVQLALEREIARNDELSRQNGRLMEVGRTTEHVIRSLPVAAGGSDDNGLGTAPQSQASPA